MPTSWRAIDRHEGQQGHDSSEGDVRVSEYVACAKLTKYFLRARGKNVRAWGAVNYTSHTPMVVRADEPTHALLLSSESRCRSLSAIGGL